MTESTLGGRVTRLLMSMNSMAPRWLLEQPREVRRFFKFAMVGGIGAVVDFTILNLLALWLGVPDLIANVISVSAAILSNFTWNRLWTFPESRERAIHVQFGQFALVNLIGLAINETVFWAASTYVLPSLPLSRVIALNLSKLAAVGIVLFWNFGVNRLWTYRGIR